MQTYAVSEIFGETIQGEGYHQGYPCVFLRFGGCNLWPSPDRPSSMCPWCDTPQLHNHSLRDLQDLVYHLMGLRHAIGKERNNDDVGLVITGGEPFIQLDDELLWHLVDIFPWIDVETNGTLEPKFNPDVYKGTVFVSCSPKITSVIKCDPDWFKVLIPDKFQVLDLIQERFPRTPVYVQPVEPLNKPEDERDDLYRASMELCSNLSRTHGYRISLQVHKILSLP